MIKLKEKNDLIILIVIKCHSRIKNNSNFISV